MMARFTLALPGLPGSIPGQTVPVNYTILSDSAAVPEPSTLALLGEVAIGLLATYGEGRSGQNPE